MPLLAGARPRSSVYSAREPQNMRMFGRTQPPGEQSREVIFFSLQRKARRCNRLGVRSIDLRLTAVLAALTVGACSDPHVTGGRITIRNDILDKEYNSFVVDEVLSGAGATGYRKELRPGDEVTLPFKHITSLRFTRRYADLSRVYIVHCPEDFDRAVTMKLIDVHTNRLHGGCALVKKGELRSGTIHWESE